MLKDLLFPKVCLGCGMLGSYICLHCQNNLVTLYRDTCLYCEKGSNLGRTHAICMRNNCIDGCLSIFFYNPTLKKIIKNIKYRYVYDAFSELFLLLQSRHIDKFFTFKNSVKSCYIQPIPLHNSRLHARGFNQSETIGKFFANLLSYRRVSLLVRVKNTVPQAQIKERHERYHNIQKAFEIKPAAEMPVEPVILIDDIVTSGNTVREAAKTLKQAGVEKVYVFSLARG